MSNNNNEKAKLHFTEGIFNQFTFFVSVFRAVSTSNDRCKKSLSKFFTGTHKLVVLKMKCR